jgi:hypothetical protein
VRIRTLTRAALAAALTVGAAGIAAPNANADLDLVDAGTQVVRCSASNFIASLNPTIKDGTAVDGHVARYIKTTLKRSDGTKTAFLSPIPADNTTCSVDAGIRTNQNNQDVKYLLDNQSNGNATLTMTGVATALTGSTQCQSGIVGPDVEYPVAYPLQGKLIYKFAELGANGAPLQIQSYIRTYADTSDTGIFLTTGTVIKGPGVGGRVSLAFSFFPTDSTKNNNVAAGCTDNVAGNAAGAELWVIGADSNTDADALPETYTVTLGDDDSSEIQD